MTSKTFAAKLVLGVTAGVVVNVIFAACYFRRKKNVKQKEETNQGKKIINCQLPRSIIILHYC